MHKQIRLPSFIEIPNKMTDECNMIRFHRFTQRRHIGFFRCMITFPVVTSYTRGNKIFPRIFTFTRFRHNVIDRQRHVTSSAVLAAMSIAAQNVFSREYNFFVGDTNKDRKTHHTGKRNGHRYRTNGFSVMGLHQFRFPQKEQNNCLFDVAYT